MYVLISALVHGGDLVLHPYHGVVRTLRHAHVLDQGLLVIVGDLLRGAGLLEQHEHGHDLFNLFRVLVEECTGLTLTKLNVLDLHQDMVVLEPELDLLLPLEGSVGTCDLHTIQVVPGYVQARHFTLIDKEEIRSLTSLIVLCSS